jgi:hypothetical protein
MTRQQHEAGDLQDLIGALGELVGYCDALQAHANGAAAAASGAWKGMASAEFLNQVALWSAGAGVLRASAGDLLAWANAASALYESAQSNADSFWSAS